MACCTKCELLLSSSSCHFVQLVHKVFVGGNGSKKMEGDFFPADVMCAFWNKICCTFWWCSYEKLNFSSFTKGSRVNEKADATFCFTEKPASLGVGVEKSMVISKPLIHFTFTTLFSTQKIIIPVHSSSHHRLKESQPTNLISGHESWCTWL